MLEDGVGKRCRLVTRRFHIAIIPLGRVAIVVSSEINIRLIIRQSHAYNARSILCNVSHCVIPLGFPIASIVVWRAR